MNEASVAVPTRSALASRLSPTTILPIAIAIILAVAALSTTGFGTTTNIRAVLFGGALVGILAVGLSLITISGNVLSMSLGTTAAVCAIAFIHFLKLGTPVAILLTLLLGAAICGIQGYLVGVYGANPIIATIGAGVVQVGMIEWFTSGSSQTPPADASYGLLKGLTLGIPFSAYVLVVAAVLVELLLRRTAIGREMRLTGANRRAAHAAALPVAKVTIVAFLIAGVCAAATGILLGAANDSADLNLQANYSFDAIAAVLIAGTLITGGRGSAIGAAIGAIGIAVISSVVVLRGYSSGVQVLVEGIVVLVIVITAHLTRRNAANR